MKTCNFPRDLRSSHPPLCGKPAVGKLTIKVLGREAEILTCQDHKDRGKGPFATWEPL